MFRFGIFLQLQEEQEMMEPNLVGFAEDSTSS